MTEPTTALTDYLLAIFAAYFAVKLWQKARRENQYSALFWSLSFVMLALGALLGGTMHGFGWYFGSTGSHLLWKSTVQTIGFCSFFFLAAALFVLFRPPLRNWLLGFAVIKLLTFSVWMTFNDDFLFVVLDYAPGILVVAGLLLYAYFRDHNPGALWLIAGILVSFAAAGVQISGFALHQHFNHNDLYHVIQMVSLYLMYRGELLLNDVGTAIESVPEQA